MFVGSSKLDTMYLRKNFKFPDLLREYSSSLIPKEFSHVRELQDNQLYLVCMTLRKLGLMDFKELHSTIRELLKGVRVTGYVDDIVDISFTYNIVNKDKVKLYLERL